MNEINDEILSPSPQQEDYSDETVIETENINACDTPESFSESENDDSSETNQDSYFEGGDTDIFDDRAALLSRIDELERELDGQRRHRSEIDELLRIFPDAEPDKLPDSVLEQNKSGVPLAAAYALYDRIRQNELEAAKQANDRNTTALNGGLHSRTGGEYYSAEEVRAMSSDQVRKNFSTILASMKHW